MAIVINALSVRILHDIRMFLRAFNDIFFKLNFVFRFFLYKSFFSKFYVTSTSIDLHLFT